MLTNTPNTLLPDRAVLIATQEELEEKSEWYTDGTYTFRFVRVPQFLYNTAAAHLRSQMRRHKPQPPIIRKSGREMTNKADPLYKDQMERWKQEWEDLTLEANLSTSMFSGVEVDGGVPPVEANDWLASVLGHFSSIGISEEEAYGTFYHDKDRLHELWFKKFVLLRSKAVMQRFTEFQGNTEDEDEITEEDEDAAFASDLFQPEEA